MAKSVYTRPAILKEIKQPDLCHVMLLLVDFKSSQTNWVDNTKISQRVRLVASTNV